MRPTYLEGIRAYLYGMGRSALLMLDKIVTNTVIMVMQGKYNNDNDIGNFEMGSMIQSLDLYRAIAQLCSWRMMSM